MKIALFERLCRCCGSAVWAASVASLFQLAGCIAIPVPTEDAVLAGRPVTEEQLAFIKAKSTTKKEVLDQLGKPQIIWEPARVYVYEWVIRNGVLIWVVGGGYSAAGGVTDLLERNIFLIEFDSSDYVLRFEQTERPIFQSYGDFLREWAAGPIANTHEGTPHREAMEDGNQ